MAPRPRVLVSGVLALALAVPSIWWIADGAGGDASAVHASEPAQTPVDAGVPRDARPPVDAGPPIDAPPPVDAPPPDGILPPPRR